jgi:hypothetical protein
MAHKAREVVVGDDDGSLRLRPRPYRAIAAQTLGMLADLAPAGESMVDELIAERREEAAREDAE